MNTICKHKNLGVKRESVNNPKIAGNEYIINKWSALQVSILSCVSYVMTYWLFRSFYTSSLVLITMLYFFAFQQPSLNIAVIIMSYAEKR